VGRRQCGPEKSDWGIVAVCVAQVRTYPLPDPGSSTAPVRPVSKQPKRSLSNARCSPGVVHVPACPLQPRPTVRIAAAGVEYPLLLRHSNRSQSIPSKKNFLARGPSAAFQGRQAALSRVRPMCAGTKGLS